ncbi:hypothetical protein VNO77_27005 [Canavalia gladiata]|uniref:Uncharacterized protein n=1 Tax=Canavalia gladiata TaxID=3824 RepID=A0AAN9KY28_CANGL
MLNPSQDGGAGIDGFGVISPNNVPWLVWHLQRGCSGVLESLVPFDILNASRIGIGEHPTTLRAVFSFPPCMSFMLVLMMAFGVNSKTVVNKGSSSFHVGGSTRGHMMAFVPRKLPAHTRCLLRLYLELLRVGSVAWPPHFEHVRMLLFRWGGQATTLFVFSGAFNFEEVVFLG